MKIYGLKNCDTCRKVQKALPQATLIDVRESPVPPDLLAQAEEQFGAALINTRSTTWRGLSDADRSPPAQDLIAQHPAVMKRPLIEANGTLHLGWTKDTQTALGL